MNQQNFIQIACGAAGSATKLAAAIGVTPSAVTQWGLQDGDKFFRRVPAERCPQIEQATNGLVRCEDLRPDVAWSVLRGTPAQPAAQGV